MTEEMIYVGKYINVIKLDNFYEAIEVPNAVAVLAQLKNGRFVLVKQKRPVINMDTIEVPAGLIDVGETPLEAVKRELLEETGLEAEKITEYKKYYHSSGHSRGYTILFFATGCEKVAEQNLDENENITLKEVTQQELEEIDFHDAKSNQLKLEYFLREYKWKSERE